LRGLADESGGGDFHKNIALSCQPISSSCVVYVYEHESKFLDKEDEKMKKLTVGVLSFLCAFAISPVFAHEGGPGQKAEDFLDHKGKTSQAELRSPAVG
jgi:hypothetical protein